MHLVIIALLTVVTQVGGIVYIVSVATIRQKRKNSGILRLGVFTVLYPLVTFLLVPVMAPIFGREKIKESEHVKARSLFYKLANRNYVKPELNSAIGQISQAFSKQHPGLKLVYLDANFPFLDKFPLLPHLSHNDGKKIDISLVYEDSKGNLTNKKPSVSGYGVYEGPQNGEYDQIQVCKDRGSWQYDFPKYLTFGHINRDIKFSNPANRKLIQGIVRQKEVGKLFIEPHLKSRLNLNHSKIRFHGCQAVRHDDHIHFQLK